MVCAASAATPLTRKEGTPPGTPARAGKAAELRPSGLAAHFSRNLGLESSLKDVVDHALPVLWQCSERFAPDSRALEAAMPATHREETISWLLQAFDILRFADTHLFGTAQLLDRYYASTAPEQRYGCAQRRLLASVSLALKTGTSTDVSLPTRQAVTDLGKDQVRFDDVMLAELDILRQLNFQVCAPTVLDFLEAFSIRLQQSQPPIDSRCLQLANFLLQLTLSDVHMHYHRHSQPVLVASALILAIANTHTNAELRCIYQKRVLEDFAVCCPPLAPDALELVHQVMDEIRHLWEWTAVSAQRGSYLWHVCHKFSRPDHLTVAAIVVPAATPKLHTPVLLKLPQITSHASLGIASAGSNSQTGSGSSSSSSSSTPSSANSVGSMSEASASTRASTGNRAQHGLGTMGWTASDGVASEGGRRMRSAIKQRERVGDRELPSKKLESSFQQLENSMARLRRRLRRPDGVPEDESASLGHGDRPSHQVQLIRSKPRRAQSWASGSRPHSAPSATATVAAAAPGAPAAASGLPPTALQANTTAGQGQQLQQVSRPVQQQQQPPPQHLQQHDTWTCSAACETGTVSKSRTRPARKSF